MTPFISRPTNNGQPSNALGSILTSKLDLNFSSICVTKSRLINSPIPRAARSLAIPLTPNASGRFGVIAISITDQHFLDGVSLDNQQISNQLLDSHLIQ